MKKLQNNYTTIEQSKRLLELGVPADSADMYYTRTNPIPKVYIEGTTRHAYHTPCWSVGRLIEIMNICSMWGNVSIHRTDRQVTQIEQLIEILQNRINGKTIDFSKLEE